MGRSIRPEDIASHLAKKLGPHVNRFAEYAIGELMARAIVCARGEGLTAIEANQAAALCVQNAVRALAQSIQHLKRERAFKQAGGL